MPPENKAPDEATLHSEIISEFHEIEWNQRDERRQATEDRRFYSIAGAQYEGRLGELYANKPQLEFNKTHLSVIRIFNEYRNNRITVDYISKDGSDRTELADLLDGLYRADEQDSVADEAYDNAFEEGVGGGFGAWRLRVVQEDEDDDENEYQRIAMEPIFDADTCVYFDMDAHRQDKSDATRCWVLIPMTPEAFRLEFDREPASINNRGNEDYFDWRPENTVYIAEHYRIENREEKVFVWESLEGEQETFTQEDFETDEVLEAVLLATGWQQVDTKKVRRKRVHKYLVDGAEILRDCGIIAGTNIPIIPFYGKRWVVQNIERFMGHVRLQKDAQRLINVETSQLAQIAALSPTEKPIFLDEQMQGHEDNWADDNVLNLPYQTINAFEDSDGNSQPLGPVGTVKPPSIPPALANLLQITNEFQSDLAGNQQMGEEIRSNISGEAYSLIQSRLDMQTFIYMSNFAKAMRRCGEIYLGMKKETAVEPGRVMKTVGRKGEVSSVELMERTIDENGGIALKNDLREAKFDVVASVGPSSSSKKQATVRGITEMLQFTDDPQDKVVLASTAILNMEGEGLDSVQEYFRKKLVRMGVEKPTPEEEEQMMIEAANQQPDAQEVWALSEAEKNRTQAIRNEAETIKTLAETEETKAKTAETLAGIDRDDQEAAVKTARTLFEVADRPATILRGAE